MTCSSGIASQILRAGPAIRVCIQLPFSSVPKNPLQQGPRGRDVPLQGCSLFLGLYVFRVICFLSIGFLFLGVPAWSDTFLSPLCICILSPIFLHIDSGLEIRWVCFEISGLGDLQSGWGCLSLYLGLFVACLGPLRLGLHCFSVDWGFSPLILLLFVFVCDKWLLLVCVAFFVSCCCFIVRSETPAEGPFPFLLASILISSLSVLVGLSSYAVCLCLVCFVCCPLSCLFWRLCVSSPLPSCCALLLGVFLLAGGAWWVWFFCFFA